CALGYIWLGYCEIYEIYSSAPLHLIALGYYFAMILFIFIVAGLRHSGFIKLKFPLFGILALVFMLLSTFVRSLLTEFSRYIHLSAFLLILSFGFYAFKFFKIFTQNPFSDDPE
ncbi:MAG: NnrS family protein, partial [Campylobacter sp.]|nr:NnrS family protein [Campylobacter sp.]